MHLLPEERKQMICEYVQSDGTVRVTQLSSTFGVTTETIRKDLEELELIGKLKKVHGGAVRVEQLKVEPSMQERIILRQKEKQKIAEIAASFIEENDMIFIDEGSTPLQMVPYLPRNFTITIITHSFAVAQALHQHNHTHQVLFLGGWVNGMHSRTSGYYAEQMARSLVVNKAFL
ncbi:MAG: DeoR/GlpR family DNA-binding transcription regulator, partial [Bacilli bacterium]